MSFKSGHISVLGLHKWNGVLHIARCGLQTDSLSPQGTSLTQARALLPLEVPLGQSAGWVGVCHVGELGRVPDGDPLLHCGVNLVKLSVANLDMQK